MERRSRLHPIADSYVSAAAVRASAATELASIRQEPLRSIRWDCSAFHCRIYCWIWVAESLQPPGVTALTGKVCFFFNGCRSYCNASMLYWYASALSLCREWGAGPLVINASFVADHTQGHNNNNWPRVKIVKGLMTTYENIN